MATFLQWALLSAGIIYIAYNIVSIIKTVKDRKRAAAKDKQSEVETKTEGKSNE